MRYYLTDKDVQDYGPELIDFAQRAAFQVFEPQLQQLQNANAELQHRLAIEARRNLDNRVRDAVPDYAEIDRDPAWHAWLRQVDTLTGQVRQLLLNDAISQGATNRVISFFRAFKQQHGGGGTERTSTGRTRTARVAAGAIYSRSEIARLYDKHHKGGFRGREDEWARIEADIFRAAREGRVLNPVVDVAGK